jgi:hypothetical protein
MADWFAIELLNMVATLSGLVNYKEISSAGILLAGAFL